MLTVNPHQRASVAELLKLPFFDDAGAPSDLLPGFLKDDPTIQANELRWKANQKTFQQHSKALP